MKWFMTALIIASSLIIVLVGTTYERIKIRDLTEELSAAKTELSITHVEKTTCEALVQRGREEAVVRGRCMFPCADLDCRDRCQSCYRLVTDVKESLKIRNGR